MDDQISDIEKEKSLYRAQIQYLQKKLERCQLKCHELEEDNLRLICRRGALEADKQDICEHLKHSVSEKKKMVDELTDKLEIQKQVSEQELKELRLQQSAEVKEPQEQVDALRSETGTQAVQIEQQQEQMKLLEQQLSDTDEVKDQLFVKEKQHEAAMISLNKELLLELMMKARESKEAANKLVRGKMTEIILEQKAQLKEKLRQLQPLELEVETLSKKKKQLQRDEVQLHEEIDKLKENAEKLEQEIPTREKRVEELMEQSQLLEVEMEECSCSSGIMQTELDDLQTSVDLALEKRRRHLTQADQLKAELRSVRSREKLLDGDMKEAADVLRHIMRDPQKASETQLNRLLEVLQRNAPPDTNSALLESIAIRSGGSRSQSPDSPSARAEAQELATDPLFLLARLRPGDLGLSPSSAKY